jgi:hypothetical protein
MTKDEIIYFLSYGLSWLIPASYDKEVEEVKMELGL